MILTITMNPSIDISYHMPDLAIDTVNRVETVDKTPGGKGLNVTRVLHQLGVPVVASGLAGALTGQYIKEELEKLGIQQQFYDIAGATRHCIAILHNQKQTEILEAGPVITEKEADGFLETFKQMLAHCDVVALSGSLPKGLPTTYYSQMVAIAKQANKQVVLDSSGPALAAVLDGVNKPTVIKPNTEELSQLLQKPVDKTCPALKAVLQQPLFDDIEWVIVSLGADGMFAKHQQRFYHVTIPKIAVCNPVGSGDATVAGISTALLQQETPEQLLKRANTLGMLNAMESKTGYINIANYDALYNQIKVVEV